jgi:ABC-type branched-subunit amino acid transport system substrate-binding protein
MSFGASSPKLSDAAAYPWFARMTPSDAEGMDMAADFFNTNSIKKVGFLGDDSGYCTDNFDYFETKIAPNVRHEGSEIWPQAELTLVQAEALLTRMVEKGIKIFFLCDYTEDDLVLKQAAYNLGLTADDTNFLFAIWPPPEDSIIALATSAQTETEKANVRATHEGWVGYNAKFVSSPLKDAYKISLKEKLGNDKYTSWCEYAYDIIYLYAHSIHNLIEAEQQPFGARLKEELKKSAFVGITGPVKLEPNGDRKVDSSLYRLDGAGEKTETFVYDATAGTSTIAAGYIFKGVDTPACEAASNGEACSGQGSCTQKFIGEKTLEKVCSCNAGFAGSKCESACNAANGKADSSGKCTLLLDFQPFVCVSHFPTPTAHTQAYAIRSDGAVPTAAQRCRRTWALFQAR